MALHGNERRHKIQASITMTLVLLEWILAADGEFADETHREVMFYSIESASLIGKVTMTRLVKDEMECAFMCFRHYPRDCLSFNFRTTSIGETHICELSDSERALQPDRMQKRQEFDYFGVQTVVRKRFLDDASVPCYAIYHIQEKVSHSISKCPIKSYSNNLSWVLFICNFEQNSG